MSEELLIRTAGGFRARLAGLIGRRSLPRGEALLIPRCRSVHTVGMRFAIDVAFLRGDTVLALRERVPPFRVVRAGVGGDEVSALELAAGEAREVGIHPGSRLPAARFL